MIEQDGYDASSDEPRLQVEYWPLARLIPYARNARTHSEAQVAEIAGSIRAFGFSNPILVSETGDIIAGHGRLAAARKLGLTEAPVVVLRNLTEFERRQLVLADNRIALNAGWDKEMLSLELADLSGMGADLSALGFTAKELSSRPFADRARSNRRRRYPRASGGRGISNRRCLATWTSSGGLRRQQGCRPGKSAVYWHRAAADGHGPTLWRRIRPRMAPSPRRQQFGAKGQDPQRRDRGLDVNLGPISWRDCVCLAWGSALNHRCR